MPIMKRYILAALLLFLVGCAAQQPQIDLRPVKVKSLPPPPRAVNAFIVATVAEKRGDHDQAIHALRVAIQYDTTSATLYGALARNLITRKYFAEAIEPAQNAIKIDPTESEYRWNLYHAFMKGKQDTTQGLAQLNALLKMPDVNPLYAYNEQLQIYGSRGQNALVVQTLDRISALPGLGARERMIAAQNYAKFDAEERAVDIYQSVIKEEPSNIEAYLRLGDLQFSNADTASAEKIFRAAVAQDNYKITRPNARVWGQLIRIYRWEYQLNRVLADTTTHREFIKTLGQVFLDMAHDPAVKGDDKVDFYQRSEAILDYLLNGEPSSETLLAAKAQLLLETERPSEARHYFNLANQQQEKAQYWLGIARTHIAEKNWDGAQHLLEELLSLAPPNSEFYSQIVTDLAQIHLFRGNVTRAREIYTEASEALPEEPEYRYALARTYLREQEWDDAIALLDPLQAELENRPDVLFDLGHSYERAGQIENAENSFLRLLSLYPDHAGANNYLGYMLAERGERLSEAIRYIQKAVNADPENGAYLDSLGWVHYQMGNYREAMEWLIKAVTVEEEALKQANPNNERQMAALYENLQVIHEHAGDAAKAIGDLRRAREHYERALKFAPDNETIKNKLQKITDNAPSTSEAK